jgi:ubiquinone/menaquinone biosynthesis C-methylase UbiE
MNKRYKKIKHWHEQNEFWHATSPILFRKARWEQTPEEVENIISLLGVKQGKKILDLCCGVGRHSIEFARRGFKITGVDATTEYLKQARRKARKARVKIEFIKDDMRRFYRENTFDAVVNLFTSFGYFENQKDDYRVVQNIYTSLKKGGVFLIEIMGKEVLARIFQKRDWYEINGLIVLEERETDKNWEYIKSRWILIKGKNKKEFTITLRLYSAVELSALLRKTGFKKIDVYGDLAGTPYDHIAKRLVVVAQK